MNKLIALTTATVFLVGCSNSEYVFITKSTVGMDFSTSAPNPQLDLGIARQELVIGPATEDGTFPVLGGFRRDGALDFSTDTLFAGGVAAITLARGNYIDILSSAKCLTEMPVPNDEENEESLFRFGTATNLGIKIGWGLNNNTTNLATMKVGYNREEVAFAPIKGRKLGAGEKCQGRSGYVYPDANYVYQYTMPSFIAVSANQAIVNPANPSDTKLDYVQYIATGQPSWELVNNAENQKIMEAMLGIEPAGKNQTELSSAEKEALANKEADLEKAKNEFSESLRNNR